MAAPTITPLPTAPQRQDSPSDFVTKADAWVAAIDTWTTEANSQATFNDTRATDSDNSATASAASAVESSDFADNASASADVSASNANFVGPWVDQTGAANIPYSVLHENLYWQLINNLADITTSEPGVTGDWARSGTGSTVFLNSAVLSGETSVDFTIPAGFTSYLIEIDNLIGSVGASTLIRTSSDGGSSFDAGASDYKYIFNRVNDASSVTGYDRSSAASSIACAFAADGPVNGTIHIFSPSEVQQCSMSISTVQFLSGTFYASRGGGARVAVANVDAIRITRLSGTMTSGKISMYGIV